MADLERLSKELAGLRTDFRTIWERMVLEGIVLAVARVECARQGVGWYHWLDQQEGGEWSGDKGYRRASERMRLAKDEYRSLASDAGHHMSLRKFIRAVQSMRKGERKAEIERNRQQAIEDAQLLPQHEAYKIVTADCRDYAGWPDRIPVVACDPPWKDMGLYRWLGQFCMARLEDGGLLLVQCDQQGLPAVLSILRSAGLTYQWAMAVVYQWSRDGAGGHRGVRVVPPFMVSWRAVLLFTRGRWAKGKVPYLSDTHTSKDRKNLHEWQQPLSAYTYWLGRLTMPGQLICDPFVGSGTTAVAVKKLGERRRFLGCEIDPENAEVARGALARAVEGSHWRKRTVSAIEPDGPEAAGDGPRLFMPETDKA